jgi:hypothetical protein
MRYLEIPGRATALARGFARRFSHRLALAGGGSSEAGDAHPPRASRSPTTTPSTCSELRIDRLRDAGMRTVAVLDRKLDS